MRANLVIPDVREFIYCIIKYLHRIVTVDINLLSLEGIVIPLHRSIVIRTAGAAHTLRYAQKAAERSKINGRKLCALIRMKNQLSSITMLRMNCLVEGSYRKIGSDIFPVFACDHAPIVKVDDSTIVTDSSVA